MTDRMSARSDLDRRHKLDLLGSSQQRRFFTFGLGPSVYSDLPVNIITGSDNNGDRVTNDRPLNVPRNVMHGPGLINLDLNVSHNLALSKSREHAETLSVLLNSFNVLNHVSDVTYIGVIISSSGARWGLCAAENADESPIQVLKIISAWGNTNAPRWFIWLIPNSISPLAWKRVSIPFDLALDRFRVNTNTSLDCSLANDKPDDRVRKKSEKCQSRRALFART
jgi:hypothetical protein